MATGIVAEVAPAVVHPFGERGQATAVLRQELGGLDQKIVCHLIAIEYAEEGRHYRSRRSAIGKAIRLEGAAWPDVLPIF